MQTRSATSLDSSNRLTELFLLSQLAITKDHVSLVIIDNEMQDITWI